jgi:hypothetical protein
MIKEHDRAVLIVDLPDYGLRAGDVGVVVHIYNDGAAYEIEFFALDGHTLDVATVEADQVRPISRDDIVHARRLSA